MTKHVDLIKNRKLELEKKFQEEQLKLAENKKRLEEKFKKELEKLTQKEKKLKTSLKKSIFNALEKTGILDQLVNEKIAAGFGLEGIKLIETKRGDWERQGERFLAELKKSNRKDSKAA